MASVELQDGCEVDDDRCPDPVMMISYFGHHGNLLDHKVDESFMTRHRLEAGLKLTCSIEGGGEHSNIYASSALDTFEKLKQTISECTHDIPMSSQNTSYLHIEKFVLKYTDAGNDQVSSEIKQKSKKYRKTGTEYSPETFNAMMKATTAQVSITRDYCVCGDVDNCEMARHCPEIHVHLSRLDGHHERVNKKHARHSKNVHPDKVVTTYFQGSELDHKERVDSVQSHKTPKLMISQSCLQRLMKSARNQNTLESPAVNSTFQRPHAQSEDELGISDNPIKNRHASGRRSSTWTGNVLPSRLQKMDRETMEILDSDDDDDVPMGGVARYRRATRG